MIVARRVYLYAIAFAALGMLVTGLAMVCEVLFETIAERALGIGDAFGSGTQVRQVSFAAATGGIGLVAWAIHWGLAARAAAGPDGAAERRSGIRKLYLYVALLAGGIWLMSELGDLLGDLFQLPTGETTRLDVVHGSVLSPLAWVLVLGPFFAYHARVVRTDRALVPEAGAGATLRRWCVYGLAFVGLLTTLFAAAELLSRLLDGITSPGAQDLLNDHWLAVAVARQSGAILAGMLFWVLAWNWSTRLYAADSGPDLERDSVLRKVYLYLVLFLVVSWSVWSLGHTLYVLLYWLLVPAGQRHVWDVGKDDLIETATQLFVCALAWAYHARVVAREAAGTAEPQRQSTVRWIYSYLVAFVGAATLASGLGGTLSTLVDAIVEGRVITADTWFADQISLFGTLIVVGLPVWYIPWSRLQREVTAATARRSLVRRIYLFLILGTSVLALLSSGVYTVYVLLRLLLGDRSGGFETSSLIDVASAAAVAILFLVYNLRVFQRDAALAGQDVAFVGQDGASDNEHAVPALSEVAATGVTLLIVRPAPDADLADLRQRLEQAAAPGASVRVATVTHAEAQALLERPT